MRSIPVLLLVVVATSHAKITAEEQQWGSVSGQFTFLGDLPERPEKPPQGWIKKIRDGEVCGPSAWKQQDLVVDKKTRGIANIFVYERFAKVIHPSFENSIQKPIHLSIKACEFTPHCLLVRTGQPIRITSSDGIAHNFHDFPIKNSGYSPLISPRQRDGISIQYLLRESLPFQVRCDFHSWMKGHVLVLDHPYAAITDSNGKFTIKCLSAGEHEFRVWHERVGYINRALKVTVTPDKTTVIPPIGVEAAKFAKVRATSKKKS